MHQPTVRLLIQRVKSQPARGIADCHLKITLGAVAEHQPVQSTDQLAAQGSGLKESPVVIVHAVPQAKSTQEFAANEPNRLSQGLNAGGTYLSGRMAVAFARGHMLVELIHIHPDIGLWMQADLLPVHLQPVAGKGFGEDIQSSTKSRPSARAVVLGPEQVDQRSAPVAFTGDGDVRQEGNGLAPIHLDWNTVALDARWAKQVQSKAGHKNTSFSISVLEILRKVNRNATHPALPSRLWSRFRDAVWLSYVQEQEQGRVDTLPSRKH